MKYYSPLILNLKLDLYFITKPNLMPLNPLLLPLNPLLLPLNPLLLPLNPLLLPQNQLLHLIEEIN
jgi:hypothetical protein